MKIILTENQIEFIRRYKKIKELVDEGIDVLSNDEDLTSGQHMMIAEQLLLIKMDQDNLKKVSELIELNK